jgi:hypothetical protein
MHWCGFILLIFTALPAHAEMRVTLPLQGYYRPGMCMPVRVEGDTTETNAELSAEGALATRVSVSSGRVNAVVAFLPARPIDELRVDGISTRSKLHALSDGTRLIGTALAATRPATAPAGSVIIPLDPADPVPGPAMAWEALDELVLDAAGAERLGYDELLALLALSIDIIVPGEARPAIHLPWQREGSIWALRYEPLGPRGSIFAPAMLPVVGWQPGLPEPLRRHALLGAVVFAILATAVALWRMQRVVVAFAGLVAVSMLAIGVWQSRQPTIRLMQGTIAIQRGPFTQRDEWRYLFATEAQPVRPLIDARHVAESPESLLAQPTLSTSRIPRGGRIALLSRSVSTMRPSGPIEATVTSPLAPLIRAGYLRPGVTVVGQLTHGPWPTVVLRATEP